MPPAQEDSPRKRPGRPRTDPTPKKLGPVRIKPELYERLDRYLDSTEGVTQRSTVEDALDAFLPA